MIVGAQTGEFGALTSLVTIVGSLMAAAVAIGRAWRGRERWEPAEQDVPAGAERVGNLACAVLIVVLWLNYGTAKSNDLPTALIMALLIICISSLLAYAWLIGAKVYEVPVVKDDGRIETSRIIGGFRLTGAAQTVLQEKDIPIEDLLKGVAYRPDRVWTRESRSTAKVLFVALSLALTVSGTLALTTAALALGAVDSARDLPTSRTEAGS